MTTTVSLPPHMLMLGDCLERMKEIPDGSVDMVMCDLPYGTTACKWDSVIPFAPLWKQYIRVTKKNSAIVLTASQPFTSALVMSNLKMFKYSWVWEKTRTGGFWDVKFRPLKAHEDILVFGQGGVSNGSLVPLRYFPQGLIPDGRRWTAKPVSGNSRTGIARSSERGERRVSNWPRTVQRFESEARPVHNTQKPVSLMEYLIRTYTQESETVLDNCFGSASTGIACINTGRRFIGVERDPHYFDVGRRRMEEAMRKAAQPAPQGGLFDSIAAG